MKLSALPKHKLLLLLTLLYILFGCTTVLFQYRWISEYQYRSVGQNAMNLAELGANSLQITRAQVTELENMSFKEILSHPCNQQLSRMLALTANDGSIKYAYVIREVPKDAVSYWVNEDDADFFGHPPGTPLDYVWLLDIIVNRNEQVEVSGTKDYYIDKHRYTHAGEEIRRINAERKPSFFLWMDEWGTQIAGLAPIYTVEGDYVGLFGVDIYSDTFYSYQLQVLASALLLLLLPSIVSCGFYLYFHLQYRKRMSSLVYEDQLTGIYNRRYYEEEGLRLLADAQKTQQALTVLLGDLDNFKNFNDTYGHPLGDEVLQGTAAALQQCMKGKKGFVARYGGEEFVIVTTESDSATLCEDMRQAVQAAQYPCGNQLVLAISMSFGGYRASPSCGVCLTDYLRKADHALYRAKASGKNCVCFFRPEDELKYSKAHSEK